MQIVASCEYVQKSSEPSSLVESEAKNPLSTGQVKIYPDVMGLSCLVFDPLNDCALSSESEF